MCQNITDKYRFPLLQAADDAVQPTITYLESQNVLNGVRDCDAMIFSFMTIRTKNDLNPTSITIELYRHNMTTTKPGTLFYKKTLPWPTNNYRWQSDYIAIPWRSVIILQLNELGDDGHTRFNFHNDSFLPGGETFWFSFYVAVSQHLNSAFRMNSMYWVTLNNETGSTPVVLLPGETKNHDFVFRDVVDLLHYNFVEWTTATLVEPVMEITPTTHNLAWTLELSCEVSTRPTSAPTSSPTDTPTSLTLEPTTAAPTSDATNVTIIEYGHGYIIASVMLPVLFIAASIVTFIFVIRRKHNDKNEKIDIRKMVGTSDNIFDEHLKIPVVTTDTKKNLYFELGQKPMQTDFSFTSGDEMVPVELDDLLSNKINYV